MLKTRSTIVAAGVMLLALGAFCFAGPWYTVTDLGTLGGENASTFGLSDAGHVVGTSETVLGEEHAYIWQDGVIQDLGLLPGYIIGDAQAVNSSGQVAGVVMTHDYPWDPASTSPPDDVHAFFWDDGVISDLGTLPGDPRSMALDINESGQVVGDSGNFDDTLDTQGFLWEDGVMTSLPTLGGIFGTARAINDLGQVVGSSLRADGTEPMCMWEGGVVTDLGLPGSFGWAQGRGINNLGQVSAYGGYWDELSQVHQRRGLMWEGGVYTDLGTLGGTWVLPRRINDAGQIVGRSSLVGGEDHAFLWQNGVMYDLNNLVPGDFEWLLNTARDVNESGQIVARGILGGVTHAFLLTPVPVPAPGAVVLGILGVGFAAVIRKIRRR